MGTEKRERQKANRAAKMAEAEVVATKEVRESATKRFGLIAAIVAGIIALVVLFSVLSGGDDAAEDDLFNFGDDTEETVEAPELLTEVPDDFVPFGGSGALANVVPAARNGVYSSPPAMTIDTAKDYSAAIITDAGTFRFNLFDDQAPVTVNNFVNLARDGYYNGVVFHRVLEGFMAQGGDPTASGAGGPGYSFEDEFVDELAFDRPGLLAMANSGAATNGSQFFITFEDSLSTQNLTGRHTIFGELINDVTDLDNVVLIDPDEPDPSIVPTVITAVRIVES